MSDENQVVDGQVADTQVEASPVESEARGMGWVPKDEYRGDEAKWVEAGEFIRRGELFEKINRQGSEVKELRKALDQLKAHHVSVKETAYKEALQALRNQKRDAFEDGDADKILQIEEKIEVVKDEQRQFEAQRASEAAKVAQEATSHPEFVAWTNRNTWYNSSKPMRAFADAIGAELHQRGMSNSDILREVEKQVRTEFASKFENPNRAKAPAVEGTSKSSGGKKADSFELSDTERSVMERFVRTGVMTREQYIADIKKTRN